MEIEQCFTQYRRVFQFCIPDQNETIMGAPDLSKRFQNLRISTSTFQRQPQKIKSDVQIWTNIKYDEQYWM